MNELEDEWSTGNDALAAGEKVATYDPTLQKLGVSCENLKTAGSRLTFRGHWTFQQTGFQPFDKARLKAHLNTS